MKNGLFALIEVTETTATHIMTGDLQRISMHGKLLKATGRPVVGPVINSVGYAQFTCEQLTHYVRSLGAEVIEDNLDALQLSEMALRLAMNSEYDMTPIETLKQKISLLPDPDEDGVVRLKVKAQPAVNQNGRVIPERPKGQSSTTGAVWAISDRLYAENPQLPIKELRKLIMAECEAEEINPGTSGVQYSKWKLARGF